MAKKWSELSSISDATATHEFVVIQGGFSKRISKQNFLKELVAKDSAQDVTISGLASSISANANNITQNTNKITALEAKSIFTSEFKATNPDSLITEGIFVNEHASLPFELSSALVTVDIDVFTGKLWQYVASLTNENQEGYRIQDTTVGTWGLWVETRKQDSAEFLGVSLATTQQPATTDTIRQVEFGVAQNGTHGHANLAVDGTVTFLEKARFRIGLDVHFGRAGATGVSLLFGRYLLNGVPFGSTLHARMDDADVLRPYSSSFTMNAEAGDTLVLQIYRDSSGNNSGGLFSAQPALAGWALSPSASISVTKV